MNNAESSGDGMLHLPPVLSLREKGAAGPSLSSSYRGGVVWGAGPDLSGRTLTIVHPTPASVIAHCQVLFLTYSIKYSQQLCRMVPTSWGFKVTWSG